MGYDTSEHIIDVEIIADRPDLIPNYQSPGAAGLDLHSAHANNEFVFSGDTIKIHTGVRINMLARRDVVALVFPRSGTATKKGLVLANTVGVIDSDYQGEIILMIRNVGAARQMVEPGERLAQLVFMPILLGNLLPVKTFSHVTERGEGGFGSTGGSGVAVNRVEVEAPRTDTFANLRGMENTLMTDEKRLLMGAVNAMEG